MVIKKRPPIVIPTVWKQQWNGPDWEKELEEAHLLEFMKECRERTADMHDEEKCEKCKLRFRCYTEIKVKKKRKTAVKKSSRKIKAKSKLPLYPLYPLPFSTKKIVLDELKQPVGEGLFNALNKNTKSNT